MRTEGDLVDVHYYYKMRHLSIRHRFNCKLLLLLALCLVSAVVEAKVPAVIVFGDSSVDTGNNNRISTVLKSNFLPYGRDFEGSRPTGRFCNGRIPADFISEAFGLQKSVPAYLDPSYGIADFATGVVFASAGTGYDNATSNVLDVIPLWKELEYYKEYQSRLRYYLGDQKANETISEALYLMSMGTNDFLENYYSSQDTRSKYTVSQYQDFLVRIAADFIKELYGLGGRKVSLGGLPPMGCLPLERTTNFMQGLECNEEYNNVAVEFNRKLKIMMLRLNTELPGIRIVLSNPYPLLKQIIRRPSLYGFEETTRACCSTGRFEMGYMCNQWNPLTCRDASKFVFWDSFHPTERTNFLLSDHIIKRVLYVFR